MKIFRNKSLGQPDIEIHKLKVWVIDRENPDADDYWDSNWLNVIAACDSLGAEVWVEGPLLHLSEIDEWAKCLNKIKKFECRSGELSCMEPNIGVKIHFDELHKIGMLTINITPDHVHQQHQFSFEIDQSFLEKSIENIRKVLNKFPIKGAP